MAILSFSLDYIESVFVESSWCHKTIVVGCIYRPPNGNIQMYLDMMERILSELPNDSGIDVYIAGDFNLNILESHHNLLYLNFINLFSSIAYIPLYNQTNSCRYSYWLPDFN